LPTLSTSCFFYSWWSECLPLHWLPLRFWIVLKNPRFVTGDDILRHIQLFCDSFRDVRANVSPVVFLFPNEVFRDHCFTELPRVQLLVQDLSYRHSVHINHPSNHLNAQTSIFPNSFTDLAVP
jgi:hypothetical protein